MTLLNPAFMYAATWVFVLFIYSFRLSYLLDPIEPATAVLVLGTCAGFIAGWMLESLPYRGCRFALERQSSERTNQGFLFPLSGLFVLAALVRR